jgi:vacuolar protein sorting-associated protein 13A/C
MNPPCHLSANKCSNIPDSGGAFKVTVYSPYVLLNRTGLELDVRSKAFLGATKAAAGQGVFANSQDEAQKPKPFMFSFGTDDQKNRALIKVGESQWSKPQSFDAIGSTYNVTLPSSRGGQEMDVGVQVEEGEGKVR